jgi:carbamoyl-phosphate synthase/aspartate carbamoyltransferase
MAVDFAVPLITNVKNAKLLAEALVRKLSLDVSSVDSKSSHDTHIFPGLINIAAFVPNLTAANSQDFARVTKASIGAGFTTALILPLGDNDRITEGVSLDKARANAAQSAHCNYALSIAASANNIHTLDEEIQADTKSLFIPFHADNAATQISVVAAHFASWPVDKLIMTDAKGSDLASVLLLASLHNRSVHVTDVRNKDDLLLISLSKAKHLKVTCDVSVFALFFTSEQFSNTNVLPSAADQETLWRNLTVIDAFSVGSIPYRLASDLKNNASPSSGIEETLPLLLTAVTKGRLKLEDIRQRLHDNPIRIFGLPDQSHTHVEVVIGRRAKFSKKQTGWSPIEDSFISGAVHRVVVHGHTAFLDGSLSSVPLGRDVSSATISHQSPSLSVPGGTRPDSVFAGSSLIKSVDPSIQGSVMSLATAPSAQLTGASLARAQLFHNLLPHPAFHRRHILSVKQFGHRDVHDLFSIAHEMRLQVERNGTLDILKGKVLCTLFYEPSTRTSSSFDAAMKRCGGQVIQVNADSSSVTKGESLPDTVRTLGCYADAIVMRHPDVGSSQLAAKFSPVPILNAGDGIGEHPTQVCRRHKLTETSSSPYMQALLDVYTIRSELGTVNGRTITLLGDLKNGRTVHSLVTLLCIYSVRLNFVSPRSLSMPSSVVAAARKAGAFVQQFESLEEVLEETDVLYVTRVQKERFDSDIEWQKVKDAYRVDHGVLARAKEEMIVMHPLPRLNGT